MGNDETMTMAGGDVHSKGGGGCVDGRGPLRSPSNPKSVGGERNSSPRVFHPVAQFRQFCLYFVAMIPLYLDGTVLNSATGTAQSLELLRERCDDIIPGRYASYHRDGLSAAMFAVAHHTHDAIIFLRGYLIGGGTIALAVFIRFPACGTGIDSAAVRRIDQPIWH